MVQIVTSSACWIATLAFCGPLRIAIRRYLALRYVPGDREIDMAATPRAPWR